MGGGTVFAGGFVTLHRGEIPVEQVAEQLNDNLSEFDEIARLYRHWAESPMDWRAFAEILEPFPHHVLEGVRDGLRPEIGATVYDGYNASARYATHGMSSHQSAFRPLKRINQAFQNEFPFPSS